MRFRRVSTVLTLNFISDKKNYGNKDAQSYSWEQPLNANSHTFEPVSESQSVPKSYLECRLAVAFHSWLYFGRNIYNSYVSRTFCAQTFEGEGRPYVSRGTFYISPNKSGHFFHSPACFWWAAQKLTSLIHTWGSRSSKFGWIGWRKSDGENSPANGRKFFSFRAFFNQPGTVKCFALMLLIGLDLWFGLGCGRPWEVPVSPKPYLSIFGFDKIQSADFGSQVLKCLVCSSCLKRSRSCAIACKYWQNHFLRKLGKLVT